MHRERRTGSHFPTSCSHACDTPGDDKNHRVNASRQQDRPDRNRGRDSPCTPGDCLSEHVGQHATDSCCGEQPAEGKPRDEHAVIFPALNRLRNRFLVRRSAIAFGSQSLIGALCHTIRHTSNNIVLHYNARTGWQLQYKHDAQASVSAVIHGVLTHSLARRACINPFGLKTWPARNLSTRETTSAKTAHKPIA